MQEALEVSYVRLEHLYVHTLSSINGITTEASAVFSFAFWVRIVDNVEMVISLKVLAESVNNIPIDCQFLQLAFQLIFIDSNKGVADEALQL